MSDEKTRAGANPAREPATAVLIERCQTETETLLNSLIEECRGYVRIIGENFLDPQTDPHTRWKFVEMMMELVKTGANVGDTVARLRGGGARETRQRIIVERTVRGEGGEGFPENE